MVELWRGGLLENTHLGHAVICDGTGRIVEAWGDPGRVIFPRSSCKMLQALPLVESGAADAADHEVLEAGTIRTVADGDARLVANQIADVLHVLAVDVLGRDHRDRCRHVVERAAAAHRRRGHGVELRWNGLGRRRGLGRIGCCRSR